MAERRHHRIAILGGTGAQGTGLALRLAKAGHAVTIGSRDPDKARAAAADAGARTGATIDGADNRGAAGAAEIIILTVPFAVERATVEQVRDLLPGKIVIDATVPLIPPRVSVVQLPNGQSAVAAIQELLGKDGRLTGYSRLSESSCVTATLPGRLVRGSMWILQCPAQNTYKDTGKADKYKPGGQRRYPRRIIGSISGPDHDQPDHDKPDSAT